MKRKNMLLCSALTLLPIPVGLLLWDRFPEQMVIHWGMSGQASGFGSIGFGIFFPPLAMLAALWLCIGLSSLDPGNRGRNQKPLNLVMWILPLFSNLCSTLMYALTLGLEISVSNVMVAAIGILFAAIGNYLPKCRPNRTIGIRVSWTFSSEENWNATHRFGGRVWFWGGIAMALSALLPGNFCIIAMFAGTVLITALPLAYSWNFYRQQKARGEALNGISSVSPRVTKAVWILTAALVAFVVILMFTGNIGFAFGEEWFTIEASFYSDLTVRYDTIDAVQYRDANMEGVRVGGFGSARLKMGFYENEEFGVYTRYTYHDPGCCIVLYRGDKVLVISGRDAAETREIYAALLEKTGLQ